MKYSEIFNLCMSEKKRKEERYNLWTAYVIRPLSIFLTKPFIGTKVKPTTITQWSVISSIIGFFIIIFSTNWIGNVIGWFFFFLWAVLDGVDGNYARCSKQCSPLGDLWDTTGGYAAMILIYLSTGIVSYYQPQYIDLGYQIPILILGSVTATMSIFPRLVMHKRKSSDFPDDKAATYSNKENYSFSKIVAMNLVSPTGLILIIFLVSLLCHLVNIFVIFYFIVNLGIMIGSLHQLLR